jgi:hypothetical protein
MPKLDHPNEPGKWTRLEIADGVALWKRERTDPVPLTLFYVLAPPRQAQVLYDEAQARAQLSLLASSAPRDANQSA